MKACLLSHPRFPLPAQSLWTTLQTLQNLLHSFSETAVIITSMRKFIDSQKTHFYSVPRNMHCFVSYHVIHVWQHNTILQEPRSNFLRKRNQMGLESIFREKRVPVLYCTCYKVCLPIQAQGMLVIHCIRYSVWQRFVTRVNLNICEYNISRNVSHPFIKFLS